MSAALSLGTGLVQLALVAALVPHLARLARTVPWLGALLSFFAVRAAARIATGFGVADAAAAVATDAAGLVLLTLMLVGVGRTVERFRIVTEGAAVRAAEYERALVDYRTLARHRLATPLTTISGAATTLREVDDLDAPQARALLDAIVAAAVELERVTLDPSALRPEERGLRPVPRLPDRARP